MYLSSQEDLEKGVQTGGRNEGCAQSPQGPYFLSLDMIQTVIGKIVVVEKS